LPQLTIGKKSFRNGLQSEGSKYSVWFGSGGWGGSIGWRWWNKFSVLSRKAKKQKNQDTATPVTIDNDASLQQTTNDKNSKPGI
jgi:hypothetical protein